MLFDWFTVGAQTLNFLVLVWLMKRFLYKPVLDAIDARENRIALALADAAAKNTQAHKERDEFQKKNEVFDQARDAQLSQLKDEIDTERQRLLEEARQAANALRVKGQEALTSELQTLHQDIARRSREEVFAIAQKVLADLAGATLEECMVTVFTQRLTQLDNTAKAGLAKALETASGTVQVRSAFALSAAQQEAIQSALSQAFSRDIPIQFDTTPDLISGIELSANGWKVAWNIADFLAGLEQRVDERIKAPSKSPVQPAAPEKAP
jgi:F-type H+-transporting ATPase subunit b